MYIKLVTHHLSFAHSHSKFAKHTSKYPPPEEYSSTHPRITLRHFVEYALFLAKTVIITDFCRLLKRWLLPSTFITRNEATDSTCYSSLSLESSLSALNLAYMLSVPQSATAQQTEFSQIVEGTEAKPPCDYLFAYNAEEDGMRARMIHAGEQR